MDTATIHPDPSARVPAMPFLAAAVGGTFARVALMQKSGDQGREVEVLAYRKLACARFGGLAELLQSFVDSDAPTGVRHCVLACAGHMQGDEVLNDNSPWPIDLAQLRQAMALDDVAVLNDFEALGYALGNGPASGSRLLCGPAIRTAMSCIGPSCVPRASRYRRALCNASAPSAFPSTW